MIVTHDQQASALPHRFHTRYWVAAALIIWWELIWWTIIGSISQLIITINSTNQLHWGSLTLTENEIMCDFKRLYVNDSIKANRSLWLPSFDYLTGWYLVSDIFRGQIKQVITKDIWKGSDPNRVSFILKSLGKADFPYTTKKYWIWLYLRWTDYKRIDFSW